MQVPRVARRHSHTVPLLKLPRVSCLALLTALVGAAAQAQQSDATTLPAVQVLGDDDSITTEGSGAYTPRATAASTGLPLSLRETPQSVTVITRQRIEDQNLRSLVDVMANTPGISTQNYDSERYTFSSRGFHISNYLYDGMPTSFDTGYSAGESSIDSFIYDRIEVVRGATGLLTGAGNPSASINLVRKHAISREFKADTSLGAGTWDTYRGTLDLSTPFNANASVRGRIVSAYQRNHSFLDGYRNRKKIFYGVIDADLTPRITLSAGFNYQDGVLHVANLALTMKACEPALMQLDAAIDQRLKDDLRATLGGDPAAPALELVARDGSVLKFVGESTPETLYGSVGEIMFLEVAPKRADCSHPMIPRYQCLMVRERRYNDVGVQLPPQEDWHPLYQSIEGYDRRDGVRTVLRVKRYDWKNPPADAPSKVYVLDIVVEQDASGKKK